MSEAENNDDHVMQLHAELDELIKQQERAEALGEVRQRETQTQTHTHTHTHTHGERERQRETEIDRQTHTRS
eukprot:3795495-Rhodomonas_salina.3